MSEGSVGHRWSTFGLVLAVFSEPDRYLRVRFDTSAVSPFQLLMPDTRIAAVPYALQAEEAGDADTVDGRQGSRRGADAEEGGVVSGRGLMLWVGVGVLCLGLVACAVPNEPASTPVPTLTGTPAATTILTSTPAPTARPTPTSTASPSATPESSADGSLPRFEGCWGLETEDVSFEIQLERRGPDLQGSFLLVKMCVVVNELSACRIREGTLQGRVLTKDTSEVRLLIPEYDDEGRARLTLAPDGATLHWEELDYPTLGLADGASRYLPPSFALIRCGG